MLVAVTVGDPDRAWSELRKGGQEVRGSWKDWTVI